MYKEKTLPYSYPRSMTHILKFDSQIDEPDNYSYFCDVLLAANEEDIVEIYFSTRGGNGESMITLMNLMRNCRAEIHGYLMSSAHSAGSYLFLNCDVCHVGRHVSMLCHVVSYGTGGSHHEVKAMVEHIDKEERDLVNDTYKYFLSDKEIEELLNGKQIWLYEQEIITRLEKRQEALEAEHKAKQEAEYADMMAEFDEAELPEEILKKLTKQQLIDYMLNKVDVIVDEGGKFEIVEVEQISD
jgi:ATP-dependent Clp protease, protease subunit